MSTISYTSCAWRALGSVALLAVVTHDARAAADPAPPNPPASVPGSPSLRDFVRRIDRTHRGKTTAAVARMDVHTAAFDRSYSMVYWSRETQSGEDVLIKVLGPAQWRGHGTLKVGGRLTMYNPRTERTTLLGSSMLGDNWMGSHFTNDDLIRQTDLARDYSYTETRTWEQTVEAGPAHFSEVELQALPKAAVVWARINLRGYRQGNDVVPIKMEFFRRGGDRAPQRTLVYEAVKLFGNRKAPSSMTVTVADKPGEYTRLVYEALKFDVAIPASKLSEQALKQ